MRNSNICVWLSPEAIKEFKIIYEEEFVKKLNDEIATEKAIAVLELFKILTTHRLDLSEIKTDD